MTCCHFFCSVVFSMPVWRYPIVGDADTTVSPSSSSTIRSTPCVLGCCGPMLTVIVSVRISGIDLLSLVSLNTKDTKDTKEKLQIFVPLCPLCPLCQPRERHHHDLVKRSRSRFAL